MPSTCVKSDNTPPATVTSPAAKPLTSSLNSKVTLETMWPSLSDASTMFTVNVGARVSTVTLNTGDSALVLPIKSV